MKPEGISRYLPYIYIPVPDIYQISTIYLPDIYQISTIYLPDIYHISTRYLPDIYHISTINPMKSHHFPMGFPMYFQPKTLRQLPWPGRACGKAGGPPGQRLPSFAAAGGGPLSGWCGVHTQRTSNVGIAIIKHPPFITINGSYKPWNMGYDIAVPTLVRWEIKWYTKAVALYLYLFPKKTILTGAFLAP